MASLWKHPKSSHWTACFDAIAGAAILRCKRSTGTSDRKLATKIAWELEETGRGRRSAEEIKAFLGGIKDLEARRVAQRTLDDTLRMATGKGIETRTVRAVVDAWLARTKGEVSRASYLKYDGVAQGFLKSLEGKADLDVALLRREEIAAFRDKEAARVSTSTANGELKIVRMICNAAEADGLARNEARHVKLLKSHREAQARRAFTLPELKRVLAACDAEWRSMVLFSFYGGGMRLGDVANLTWQNVDLDAGEIRYRAKKTGRPLVIPFCMALKDHALALTSADDPKAPLHPRAFAAVSRFEGRVGVLSAQFRDILTKAGLVEAQSHEADPEKEGRAGKREAEGISFHSLRHTTVSLLKRADVGEAVAMDLAGHDSPEISRRYTSIDSDTKRKALDRLPRLD